MHLEEAIRLYENAMPGMPENERSARAVRLDIMHGHFRAGRTQAGERMLLTLVGSHPNDAELALMLPNIFVTTLPDILSEGSSFFYHADGLPFRYGTMYSPAEYSCVYTERLLHDYLPSGEGVMAPLPDQTPAKDILTCMWALLYDMLNPVEKAAARARLGKDHTLLEFLPNDMTNVVMFSKPWQKNSEE